MAIASAVAAMTVCGIEEIDETEGVVENIVASMFLLLLEIYYLGSLVDDVGAMCDKARVY